MKKLTPLEKRWVLYDVGNSAFILMATTIIPVYFKNLTDAAGVAASDSTAYWGYASSIVTAVVAVLAPALGAAADTKGYKKRLFALFLALGVLGCAALAVPSAWQLFLALFILANVGFSGSLVFYDSMLTDITVAERMDVVSSQGFAWGYIGSCVPFVGSLVLILFSKRLGISSTAATVAAFLITAVWWAVMTIPLLRKYRQNYYMESHGNPVGESLKRISNAVRDIRKQRNIFWFLLAFFFYIDGVDTIISMATVYGKDVGIADNDLLFALLLTQIIAFPCSILFGRLSSRFRPEKLIGVCIVGYFLITLFSLQLNQAWEFWFLASVVAVFQGGIQALSRSYYAKIIPKNNSNGYFGFFDIFGKGAAFMGTTVMGVCTQISGTSKAGVAAIAVMFIGSYFLLKFATATENSRMTPSAGEADA